jgi:hypothetical protein
MTRHEPLSAQTAIPPSRPAGDRAPLDGRAVMARVLGHICRRKRPCIGLFIDLFAPAASPPAPAQCWSQAGQIQKNP